MTSAPKAAALSRAEQLASRRARLREECDIQRRHLGAIAAELQYELSGIDRTVLMMRRVASKPVVVSAGVALLTLIGPKRALRWATKGAFWYGAGKKVLGTIGQPAVANLISLGLARVQGRSAVRSLRPE
jgi:hypothetical protein